VWALGLAGERRWGVEGAWNYGRGLAQCLVASGEMVYEINPRWTAAGRRSARQRGKSDSLDGRSIALLVWREGASLPRVHAGDDTVVLDLLVTEREGILAEITRLRAQLHHLLLQLDPEYATQFPKDLACAKGLAALESYAGAHSDLADARAALVHRAAEACAPRPARWRRSRRRSAPARWLPAWSP
jgi:transposase